MPLSGVMPLLKNEMENLLARYLKKCLSQGFAIFGILFTSKPYQQDMLKTIVIALGIFDTETF